MAAVVADDPLTADEAPAVLPVGLLHLLDRTQRLYERVSHLDHRMYRQSPLEAGEANPVMSQQERLRVAFGG